MPTCYCEPCYRALGHNQENNFQAEYVHCLDAECDDLNTRNNINIAVFENRQNFLSVCQSNHYQFDQVCCVFPRLWNSWEEPSTAHKWFCSTPSTPITACVSTRVTLYGPAMPCHSLVYEGDQGRLSLSLQHLPRLWSLWGVLPEREASSSTLPSSHHANPRPTGPNCMEYGARVICRFMMWRNTTSCYRVWFMFLPVSLLPVVSLCAWWSKIASSISIRVN